MQSFDGEVGQHQALHAPALQLLESCTQSLTRRAGRLVFEQGMDLLCTLYGLAERSSFVDRLLPCLLLAQHLLCN